MENSWFFLLMTSSFCQIMSSVANIPRPRGVSISKAGAYDPNKDFRCIDGSKTVPFEYVNDDYCDCSDGSDEPGTSACANGRFHCTNAGHTPMNIVSSMVNDGICDCCDGTDEYEGIITCSNTCKELGKQAREEAEKMKLVVAEAVKVTADYIEQGRKAKEEKTTRLKQLEEDRIQIDAKRNDLEGKKNEAEIPEKEAKEKHDAAWEAEKARRRAEREKRSAEEAFNELDTNNDNVVDILEMVAHMEFDIDGNGIVSDDEAKEYMEEVDNVDLSHFIEKMWPNIKDIYRALVDSQPGEPSIPDPADVREQVPPPPITDHPEDGEEDSEDDDDDPDDDDDDEFSEGHDPDDDGARKEQELKDEEEKMPDYDAETQLLIKFADEARTNFNEADEELKKIDSEISEIKSFLDIDLGATGEYYFLRGKCYELTDREYVYKLCPFDKTSQRQKSGGAETSLGVWGHWSGPENNKYSRMKYEKGQHCWNGPDRSVEVILHCGLENILTGAIEPNRCEYQFDFTTPTACSLSTEDQTRPPHTEL